MKIDQSRLKIALDWANDLDSLTMNYLCMKYQPILKTKELSDEQVLYIWEKEVGDKMYSDANEWVDDIQHKQKVANSWWENQSDLAKNGYINFNIKNLNDDEEYLPTEGEILEMWNEEVGKNPTILNGHTAGPWNIVDNMDIPIGLIYVSSQIHGAICQIQYTPNSFKEHRANAVLIASAPALKEENERLKGKYDPAILPEKYSRWDLYMLLYNLTPGGSEFALDPQACFDYIKKEFHSIISTVKELKAEKQYSCLQYDEIIALKEENKRLKNILELDTLLSVAIKQLMSK